MAQSATELERGGGPSPREEPEGPSVVARTPRQLFWARFRKDKVAIFGGICVLLMIVAALAAGIAADIVGHDPNQQYRDMLNPFGTPLGPSSEFWFGADDLGRDLFVRVLYGARVSLAIAIVATGIEVVIGVLLGMLSGYLRGATDTVISRVIDVILSVPVLLLGIALGVSLGASISLVVALIAFFGWPYIARIVRGQTLSLRESQFVEAAASVGASTPYILFREILPNLIAPILIYATLIIPVNIVIEASLSFLGVGVQEPTADWGAMLARATPLAAQGAAWWYITFPGVALFITVLGFNLLGDGLRDALDPRSER